LLLSDGIVEARSSDGPQFGIGRALKVVQALRHERPADIVAALAHEVRAWSEGAPADDMAAIILQTRG
jgi:serine phosphatase RsbU (regulator of sigma subunit)